MGRLTFRPDVERLPVFGLGCAGGVLGLGRAAALAAARPGARVLLLVVELCALTFRHGDQSNANIVASAIFGDGAAAALISAGETGREDAPALVHWGEHTWPDSLEVMGWSVENDGLGVVFSRDIPTIVRRDLGAALDSYLARHGLERGDIDHYVSHPGGAKVVRALEEAFGLRRGTLVEAREVLRRYGNMSAASVLFVLEAVRRGRGLGGRQLLSALGPGFTAAFATLEGPGTRAPLGHGRAAAAQ
jgi:alkylresorcinol/alkylpyrone synthase